MWHYFLNWTGPTNVEFLRRHGPHWSTGNIEAWCDNIEDPDYRVEGYTYRMPMIQSDDWQRLDEWLTHLETPMRWSHQQLLLTFEVTHNALTLLDHDETS